MLDEKSAQSVQYYLNVQNLIGSVLSSAIFYRINYLIKKNAAEGEDAFRYKCFSHLGKTGVCVTYKELADQLFTDRDRVAKAMVHLKDAGIIGMDYVYIETGRAPFFFLEKKANDLEDLCQKQRRYCDEVVIGKINCFNSAAIFSHIEYWNDRNSGPLIQSFSVMSEYLCITYKQVRLSIKNLIESGFLTSFACQDSRYMFEVVKQDHTKREHGSHQKGRLSLQKGARVTPKGQHIYSLSSYSISLKEEREGTPTLSHSKNEEKTKKFGNVELLESEYKSVMDMVKTEAKFDAIVFKYNSEARRLGVESLEGSTVGHLMTYAWYIQKDIVANIEKENILKCQQDAMLSNEPSPALIPTQKEIERKTKEKERLEYLELMKHKGIKERVANLMASYKKFQKEASAKSDPASYWAQYFLGVLKVNDFFKMPEQERIQFVEISEIEISRLPYVTDSQKHAYEQRNTKVISLSKVG